VNCPGCDAANSVPLPKIKVGGGQRATRPVGAPSQAAATPPPAEQPDTVAPSEPDSVPEEVEASDEDAAPEPAPAAAKHAPAEIAKPAAAPESPPPAAAPETAPPAGAAQAAPAASPTMTPRPDTAQPIAAIMLLLIVTAAIGWAAVSWGPDLLASLTTGGDGGGAFVIDAPTPQVTIGPEQLQNLVGLWKAAQIARRTIDSDLKVSLAEFEARGMVDAAATVRTAISQKEDDIEALRQRFAAIINEIASVYVDQPAAIEGLYENFMLSQTIRSDPEARQLLQMTAEAVKTSPPNTAAYNLYFE
jgi:hypothetical protein